MHYHDKKGLSLTCNARLQSIVGKSSQESQLVIYTTSAAQSEMNACMLAYLIACTQLHICSHPVHYLPPREWSAHSGQGLPISISVIKTTPHRHVHRPSCKHVLRCTLLPASLATEWLLLPGSQMRKLAIREVMQPLRGVPGREPGWLTSLKL